MTPKKAILRQIESPKFDHKFIAEKHPGFAITGDKRGWFYPIEQTKVIFVSASWSGLYEMVKNHLKGNDLAIPAHLNADMMDWWCRNYGSTECGDPKPIPLTDLRSQAERFYRSAKAFLTSGEKKAPQEEAERRAAICASCPKNQDDSGYCAGCMLTGLVASAINLTANWHTSQDDKLKSCSVCGCKNKLKVHFPLSAMNHKDLREHWPEHCWMRQDSN